jgi:hypothetical protein
MLNNCSVVIVPVETDTKSEAETHSKKVKVSARRNNVKAVDLQRKLPVQILLNIPDVLYQTRILRMGSLIPRTQDTIILRW